MNLKKGIRTTKKLKSKTDSGLSAKTNTDFNIPANALGNVVSIIWFNPEIHRNSILEKGQCVKIEKDQILIESFTLNAKVPILRKYIKSFKIVNYK